MQTAGVFGCASISRATRLSTHTTAFVSEPFRHMGGSESGLVFLFSNSQLFNSFCFIMTWKRSWNDRAASEEIPKRDRKIPSAFRCDGPFPKRMKERKKKLVKYRTEPVGRSPYGLRLWDEGWAGKEEKMKELASPAPMQYNRGSSNSARLSPTRRRRGGCVHVLAVFSVYTSSSLCPSGQRARAAKECRACSDPSTRRTKKRRERERRRIYGEGEIKMITKSPTAISDSLPQGCYTISLSLWFLSSLLPFSFLFIVLH